MPRTPLARRRPWWSPLAVLVAVALTSCAAPEATPEPAATGPLVILSGRDQSGGQRNALIAKWNARHSGNQAAKIVELPPIADAQRAEMVARAQAGTGVDIYNLDVTWTAEFAAAGYIRRLDQSALNADGFLDGFLDGPLRSCRYPSTDDDSGELFALPFNTDVGLLYYNEGLLGSTEGPQTWSAVEEAVQRVAGADPTVAGYVGQYGDYEGLAVTAQELVWSAGGELVDDQQRVLPGGEAFESGLQRLRRITPREGRPYDEAASTQLFRDNRALFMRNWPVAYRDLTGDPEHPPPAFGVVALPENTGALGGQNLAISATTDRYADALELIKFLTGDLSQAQLYRDGGLPATRGAVYDDRQPLTSVLPDALENARPRPSLPHYATLSDAFRTEVAAFLDTGRLPPTPVLRDRFGDAAQGRIAG